jgi:hypothetical protein
LNVLEIIHAENVNETVEGGTEYLEINLERLVKNFSNGKSRVEYICI